MTFRPTISILTAANGTHEPADLRRSWESLRVQDDDRWEWLIAAPSDCSPQLRSRLEELVDEDPRVRVVNGPAASAPALSELLALATAPLVAGLAIGDLLYPGALAAARRALTHRSWLFTDEARARITDAPPSTPEDDADEPITFGYVYPWLKPDYQQELALSQPFIGRWLVARREDVEECGGFDPASVGSEWYDLGLRMSHLKGAPVHLAGSWYLLGNAPSQSPPYIDNADSDAAAAARHCERLGLQVDDVRTVVVDDRPIGQLVHRPLPDDSEVAAIIPTAGSTLRDDVATPRRHVTHLVRRLGEISPDQLRQIIVVLDVGEGHDVLAAELRALDERVEIVEFAGQFNFSVKCNIGADHARTPNLLFLNDDVDPISEDWLGEMQRMLADPGVGAVGAQLRYGDGTIQHVGQYLDRGLAHHLLLGQPADSLLLGGLAQLAGERTGVTAACLLVRRECFDAVGGFSKLLPLNFNDVDFCLKVGSLGKRLLYTPRAVLTHYESQTRRPKIRRWEKYVMRERWRWFLWNDPVLSPLLRARPYDVSASPEE